MQTVKMWGGKDHFKQHLCVVTGNKKDSVSLVSAWDIRNMSAPMKDLESVSAAFIKYE